jgi:hypothetical protein
MIEVKITSGNPIFNSLLLRQLPYGKAVWGDCRFHVNNDIKIADWWFILHSTSLHERQTVLCDPKNIVFASMEPYEFHPPGFYNQFATLILCDKNLKHRSIIYKNILTWWAGISVEFNDGHVFNPSYRFNYDDLKALTPPLKQDKISIITSNNNAFPGHGERLHFIELLKKSHLSNSIDFFGGGHNPIPDKIDALLPYKYHICLENRAINNYWTEKIADPILGFALPMYYGCPNIQSYFPSGSYIPIDIRNVKKSIETISLALKNDEYSKRINAILQARAMILDDYNVFNEISLMAMKKAECIQVCTLMPPFEFNHPSPSLLERLDRKIKRIPAKFRDLI